MLLAGFIYKNYEKLPSSITVDFNRDGVDIGIKKFRLVEEGEGKRKWELEANEATIMESHDATKLKDFKVTFFQTDKKNVLLKADEGVVKNGKKTVEASGNVMVMNGEYTLESNKLHCESDTKLVTTDDFVKITGKNFTVTGKGMVSDLNDGKMEILENVKMIIYPRKND
jgi:LPS export ABC transporter protein LptC